MSGPCNCGAYDCRRCHPENFRNGRYMYVECECGVSFVPEYDEDGRETKCPDCRAAELDGVNLGDGEDRAQPSRGTGREPIPDSLMTLRITGDSLFARIREDIERGLIREARTHLNFVDLIVNANARLQGCERSEHTLQGVVRHSDSVGEA